MDGVRTYAALCIVLMHVYYNLGILPRDNFIGGRLMPFFSDFTLLFMMVSGFSLCCGYLERIKSGTCSPDVFYKKRYARILPYFAMLCLVDVAVSPGLKPLYEMYANFTLCFSLLPQMEIEVIGVGWFLGIVFLFYLLFPFFVFMIGNRRRAWCSLAASLGFMLVATLYAHEVDGYVVPVRTNMVFCMPLFLTGGIAYLYRKDIAEAVDRHSVLALAGCGGLTVCYFAFPLGGFPHYLAELCVFASWLLYAVGSADIVLNNKLVRYVSGISMEVYLGHMMIFRAVEKLRLERLDLQAEWRYALTGLLVMGGTVAFAHIVKYQVLNRVVRWMEK